MVTQYGMSELGPIQYGRGAHQVFLGRDFGEERNYSEEVASKIDAEVRKIIETCYDNGKTLLHDNWDKVERMVASLLEYETVEAEEVRAILEGRPFDRPAGVEAAPASDAQAGRPPADEPKRVEKPHAAPAEDLAGTRMRVSAALAAATFVAAAASLSTAPVAAAMPQAMGPLPRGGSYVLDPDPTVGSAAIGLWFRAPGAGYDNASPGISNLAATAAAVAPLASGKSLYALVHTVGGELNIDVYPDIVGIGAVVPAPAARRIVAAMTAAYLRRQRGRPGRENGARQRRSARRAAALRIRRHAARPALPASLCRRARALSAASRLRDAAHEHLDRASRRLREARVPRRELRARRSPATSTRRASPR